MTSKCNDPNYILTTPECKSIDTDAYNNYITQMNLYCSTDDHAISNPYCIDYINNNQFIQLTDFNILLKKKAIDLCLNNTNPNNNDNCTTKYSTIPLVVIKAEEEVKAAAEEVKAAEEEKEKEKEKENVATLETTMHYVFIVLIILGVLITLYGLYYIVKKFKSTDTQEESTDTQEDSTNTQEDSTNTQEESTDTQYR